MLPPATPESANHQRGSLVRAPGFEFSSLRLRRTRTASVLVNDKIDDTCLLSGERLMSRLRVSISSNIFLFTSKSLLIIVRYFLLFFHFISFFV